MSVAEQQRVDARPCESCGAENPHDARFCKACGSSLVPPPSCPSCGVDVPEDARFCPGCGARLVGARPALTVAAPEEPATPEAPAPAAPPAAEREALEEAAKALPAARRPTSAVGTNVLLFVGILMGLLVVIYEMNKDAEKEISPFQGGPPPAEPSGGTAEATPPAAPPPAAPAADPVKGVVKLPDGTTPPQGTLFVIVRNAGVGRGPPLAVKKVPNPTFPFTFEVGPGDVMIKGMPFTGPFDVQARLDGDGNAMTKAPGDLVTSEGAKGVKPGAEVELVLDKGL